MNAMIKRNIVFAASCAALAGCAGTQSAEPTTVAKKTEPKKDDKAVPPLVQFASDDFLLALGDPVSFDGNVKGFVERRARVGETRGKKRNATPFDIDALPAASIKEPFKDQEAPYKLEGQWATEVVARKHNYNYGYGYGYSYNTVGVEGEGFSSGMIRVGPTQGVFSMRDGTQYGGVSVMCGPNEYIQSARWEGLVTPKKGADQKDPVYMIVDGWFDRRECKAVAVRRQMLKLKTIVPELLYGFRQCDPDGSCDKNKVVAGFVIPNVTVAVSQNDGAMVPNQNAATRILVPVKRGGSEAILAQSYRADAGAPYQTRTMSIEIVQGTQDEKPFATAFVEDPR